MLMWDRSRSSSGVKLSMMALHLSSLRTPRNSAAQRWDADEVADRKMANLSYLKFDWAPEATRTTSISSSRSIQLIAPLRSLMPSGNTFKLYDQDFASGRLAADLL